MSYRLLVLLVLLVLLLRRIVNDVVNGVSNESLSSFVGSNESLSSFVCVTRRNSVISFFSGVVRAYAIDISRVKKRIGVSAQDGVRMRTSRNIHGQPWPMDV